jgi:ribosomal protein L35AE/L33A
MNAKIASHRRGRHNASTNQFVLAIDGITDRQKAAAFVGKKIAWGKGKGRKTGLITKWHGKAGALLARFSTGLPGQAVGTDGQILE